ncbi:glycine cleavage system protein GcvH [Rugosimonospora africana]|uniref:Glycine cleavage system H protein n=1 Tax=Rugosimonospora africana TaxID=556532 RepID=A0A8J3QVK3_9ACTN|nr:glycine cleavage system protein GcvH [Rugosimonospora africana]GIH17884.1 glycine cleavage system H protein [Rugosimonospora africana]
MIPDGLRYTAEHEWVAPGAPTVKVGITHFAQDSLGDIVYVQLPEPGTTVLVGQSLGEVESTKSVSEIYAPVGGTVVASNGRLGEEPELVNTDPYGAGWLVEIEPDASTNLDELLDANGYRQLTEQ